MPLAAVIREALMRAADEERLRPPSFVGAVSAEGVSARESITPDWLPPAPLRSDPPMDEEIERFDGLASAQSRVPEPA